MAQREIGNAVGEPPTTKGYTPSVFSLLPQLLERAGPQAKGKGPISGLYTVLVDGDDFNDPIADAARSILDGHINLTRDLAMKGHFPAIDVPSSASRVMTDIVSQTHWQQANYFKELLGVYASNLDMIQIGAYQPGTNPKIDEALRIMPLMEAFLKQGIHEATGLEDAMHGLRRVLSGMPHKG
jgi:flagellum-specific ATP synthase